MKDDDDEDHTRYPSRNSMALHFLFRSIYFSISCEILKNVSPKSVFV